MSVLKSFKLGIMVSGFSILGCCTTKNPSSTPKSKPSDKPSVPSSKPNDNRIPTIHELFPDPNLPLNQGELMEEPSNLTEDQEKILEEINNDGDKVLVYVKTLVGKTVNCKINLARTVGDLKILFKSKEGMPVERQHLVFSGKLLSNDNEKLSECRVENESTIHIILRRLKNS